jgi:hypothetical protein
MVLATFRSSLASILGWDLDRVTVGHGPMIESDLKAKVPAALDAGGGFNCLTHRRSRVSPHSDEAALSRSISSLRKHHSPQKRSPKTHDQGPCNHPTNLRGETSVALLVD